MRILHIAPLWFPGSEDSLGGIETFLRELLEALEKLGCKNSLVASGDSKTAAELVPVTQVNLFDQMYARTASEYAYYEQHQLLTAMKISDAFDVVHSHIGASGYVLSGMRREVLHTQHNPVTPDMEWFVRQNPDIWFSTVSNFQALKLRKQGARRCFVIPNGTNVKSFKFEQSKGEKLLFLGRMEEEKGPDLALKVAKILKIPLILAGPIVDQEFFNRAIKPFLSKQIQYVGPVKRHQRDLLFREAACVLMPSRVDEGFGMVCIEAMASGVAVVALANGALPYLIEPGLTGYVTKDENQLAPLARKAMELERTPIRERAAARFDIMVVAKQYLQLYEQIATSSKHGERKNANTFDGAINFDNLCNS